jgi:hypothetical protein
VFVDFQPLFEARWSYDEFVKMMPLGPGTEGQAFAYATSGRVDGERLAGVYRVVQSPRWRADGLYLPDAHGLIQTDPGEQVATRAGGYVVPVQGASDQWTIAHWMRFWTGAPELDWLNSTLAFGTGTMVEGEARVRYFIASPSAAATLAPGAPGLEFLGTATWRYPELEVVRPFGDQEGVGFNSSTGEVFGGVLAGGWRGWHYPTYQRTGLYQIDAHAELSTAGGRVLMRHAGLGVPHSPPGDPVSYDVVQNATLLTEAPGLKNLNETLVVGVGHMASREKIVVSYYGLSSNQATVSHPAEPL